MCMKQKILDMTLYGQKSLVYVRNNSWMKKAFLLFNLQQAELTNKVTLRDLVKNNEINLSQKVFMKLSEQIASVVVQYGLSTLSKTSLLKILEVFFNSFSHHVGRLFCHLIVGYCV